MFSYSVIINLPGAWNSCELESNNNSLYLKTLVSKNGCASRAEICAVIHAMEDLIV